MSDLVDRVLDALAAVGAADNAWLFFTSDNGGSREGQEQGTTAYFRTLHFERKGTPEYLPQKVTFNQWLSGLCLDSARNIRAALPPMR